MFGLAIWSHHSAISVWALFKLDTPYQNCLNEGKNSSSSKLSVDQDEDRQKKHKKKKKKKFKDDKDHSDSESWEEKTKDNLTRARGQADVLYYSP